MSKHSGDEIEPLRDGQQTVQIQKISTFRRVAPQVTQKKKINRNLNAKTHSFFSPDISGCNKKSNQFQQKFIRWFLINCNTRIGWQRNCSKSK